MVNNELMMEMVAKFEGSGFEVDNQSRRGAMKCSKDMGAYVGRLYVDFTHETEEMRIYILCHSESAKRVEYFPNALHEIKQNDETYFLICGMLVALGWVEELMRFIREMTELTEQRELKNCKVLF